MGASFFRSAVATALSVVAVAVVVGSGQTERPAVSVADAWAATWKVNLAKSTYRLSSAPRSSVSTLEPVEGGWKMSQAVVNAEGKATEEAFRGTFDGRDYPLAGTPVTIALTKIDDYTVDLVMKRDGVVTTTTRMVVSPDGKTRTSTTTGRNAHGQVASNVAVYDRQ